MLHYVLTQPLYTNFWALWSWSQNYVRTTLEVSSVYVTRVVVMHKSVSNSTSTLNKIFFTAAAGAV